MEVKMSLERADHFMRHMKGHAEELRNGNFTKDESYIDRLKDAQYTFLEISHDMIHVMRFKQFKGYENADFQFETNLPNDWEHHEFREFDMTSFIDGIRLKETLDLSILSEDNITLTCKNAEVQLRLLGEAIQDAEVLIKMLEKHFNQQ